MQITKWVYTLHIYKKIPCGCKFITFFQDIGSMDKNNRNFDNRDLVSNPLGFNCHGCLNFLRPSDKLSLDCRSNKYHWHH